MALLATMWASLAPQDELGAVATVSDKLLHAVGYGGLTLLLLWAQRRPRVLLSAACVMALGVVTELLQGLTGYRSAEATDLLADLCGIAVASAAWALLGVLRRASDDA